MKAVIQFTKREEARALPLRRSAGSVLPHRTYVLDAGAIAELRKSGIRFVTLSDESRVPIRDGTVTGERV